MNGFDVDGFVTSQRAKLTDEKARLERNRKRINGILPSDSIAVEKSNKLRKERQLEYQKYVGKKPTSNHHNGHMHKSDPPAPPPPVAGKTVAQIRENMSRERGREISHAKTELRDDRREPRRNGDYASLRERKLAEERRYQGNTHLPGQEGMEWEDDVQPSKARCGRDFNEQGAPQSWDREENDLMKWTRSQARNHGRAQTPPIDSPRVNNNRSSSRSSFRSTSVPNVAATVAGIAALGGGGVDNHTKRLRQLKYAEELRLQMREKAAIGKKLVVAWKEKSGTDAAPAPYRPEHGDERAPQYKTGGDERGMPVPSHQHLRFSSDNDLSPQHHHGHQHYGQTDQEDRQRTHHGGSSSSSSHHQHDNRHDNGPPHRHHSGPSRYRSQQYPEEERRHKNPPKQDRNRFQDRYDYYHAPPYGPPPPPPPRLQGYGQWDTPYYPHPPHNADYGDPYADMYYHHHHHPGNPYAPPPPGPHPPGPHPPGRSHWDGRQYEHPDDRRSVKSPIRTNVSEKDPHVSPLLGLGAKTSKSDKVAYRKELERQMAEKKDQVIKEKLARENYELRKDTEVYDPFGKGGCGAPVRDQFGNLVADLKHMRKINENRLSNNSPRFSKDSMKDELHSPQEYSPQNTILTYDKRDNDNIKKATQESYKDFLQRQVREKEEVKRKEKEKKRIEEEKELEQIERDRKRLQKEYEEEMERQRKKETDARTKNEEIKLEAERKRKIAIMQQEQEAIQDEAERRSVADRKLDTILNSSFESTSRAGSPPIPTLRHKMNQYSNPAPPRTPDRPMHESFRSSSPPVPALRKKRVSKGKAPAEQSRFADNAYSRQEAVQTTSRQESQDLAHPDPRPQESHVPTRTRSIPSSRPRQQQRQPSSVPESDQTALLTQLGAIRMHLQAELAKQTSQYPQSDIFEKAKQHKPKIAAPKVSRPKDSALNDFTLLKYNSPQRSGFLRHYPELPDSDSVLEFQQGALLEHQQDMLAKAQRSNARQRTRAAVDVRPSDSSTLSVHTTEVTRNPFADDASSIGGASMGDDFPHPHPHHQPDQRRQGRVSSPGGGSRFSVGTLQVEDMAARNEERMKRLEAILSAGSSAASSRRVADDTPADYFPQAQGRHMHAGHAPSRNTASRQSEMSLECETQHLPTQ